MRGFVYISLLLCFAGVNRLPANNRSAYAWTKNTDAAIHNSYATQRTIKAAHNGLMPLVDKTRYPKKKGTKSTEPVFSSIAIECPFDLAFYPYNLPFSSRTSTTADTFFVNGKRGPPVFF